MTIPTQMNCPERAYLISTLREEVENCEGCHGVGVRLRNKDTEEIAPCEVCAEARKLLAKYEKEKD